jgi:hypothetical protein
MKRFSLWVGFAMSAAVVAAAPAHRFASHESNRVASERERSVAAFREVATVLHSARCMNCHTVGDRPRQGDDRHIHAQNVMRGPGWHVSAFF